MSWKRFIHNYVETVSTAAEDFNQSQADMTWARIQSAYQSEKPVITLSQSIREFFIYSGAFSRPAVSAFAVAAIVLGIILFPSRKAYLVPEFIKGHPHLLVNGTRKPIEINQKIFYPADIVTSGGDYAGFSMVSPDGKEEKNIITVEPDSRVEIRREEKKDAGNDTPLLATVVNIKSGSSAASIRKLASHERFFMENPITSVEAKGTRYLVSYEPESSKTDIVLAEGKIKISEKTDVIHAGEESNEMILQHPSMVEIEKLPRKSIWVASDIIPDPYLKQLKKISRKILPSILDYSSLDRTGIRAAQIKDRIIFGVFAGELKFSPVYHRRFIAAVSRDNLLRVLFLDTENQRLIWEKKLDSGIVAKPVITDTGLFYVSGDGHIVQLNLASGRVQYKKKISSSSANPVLYKAYHPVWDNILIVVDNYRMSAIVAHNGQKIWSKSLDKKTLVHPVFREQFITINERGDIASYYLYNGDVLWRKNIPGIKRESHPIADSWMNDRFYLVNPAGISYALHKETGNILYSLDLENPVIMEPYVTPDTVQYFTKNSVLKVTNKHGKLLWEKKYHNPNAENKIFHLGGYTFLVGNDYVYKYSILDGNLQKYWAFPGAREILLSPGMDFFIVPMMDGRILTQKMQL